MAIVVDHGRDEWTRPARAAGLLALVVGPVLVLVGVSAWGISLVIGLGS